MATSSPLTLCHTPESHSLSSPGIEKCTGENNNSILITSLYRLNGQSMEVENVPRLQHRRIFEGHMKAPCIKNSEPHAQKSQHCQWSCQKAVTLRKSLFSLIDPETPKQKQTDELERLHLTCIAGGDQKGLSKAIKWEHNPVQYPARGRNFEKWYLEGNE